MSVLIKGMDMPKSCKECCFCFYDRKYEPMCLLIYGKRGESDCPLVEIPPHGRLIDADALYRTIDATSERTIGHTTFKETVLLDIRGMPTILESTMGQVNSEKAINEKCGFEPLKIIEKCDFESKDDGTMCITT